MCVTNLRFLGTGSDEDELEEEADAEDQIDQLAGEPEDLSAPEEVDAEDQIDQLAGEPEDLSDPEGLDTFEEENENAVTVDIPTDASK